jgi:hypothetical protein
MESDSFSNNRCVDWPLVYRIAMVVVVISEIPLHFRPKWSRRGLHQWNMKSSIHVFTYDLCLLSFHSILTARHSEASPVALVPTVSSYSVHLFPLLHLSTDIYQFGLVEEINQARRGYGREREQGRGPMASRAPAGPTKCTSESITIDFLMGYATLCPPRTCDDVVIGF